MLVSTQARLRGFETLTPTCIRSCLPTVFQNRKHQEHQLNSQRQHSCSARVLFLSLFVALILPLSALAQRSEPTKLFQVIHEGKLAFIDQTGKIILQTNYEDTS